MVTPRGYHRPVSTIDQAGRVALAMCHSVCLGDRRTMIARIYTCLRKLCHIVIFLITPRETLADLKKRIFGMQHRGEI